ncbi:hypothetical protein [Pedobacter chitinilyticus]|uniref:Uncharacterized protein n=1 Tax=Pedobacter chitinilyticus TaxID=2233776 RepID=A0A3S4RR72_9SPHI|nr:hypothetical protein [Pedobacter chitinilyticus]RWU08198.1 hypothetical protein DPV69_07390 [Pedobacter chitinilyticus]
MAKKYKVSYKTYLNQWLKEVPFHGRNSHPLYCQVTYQRRPIYFKSAIYELLSAPRFQESRNGKRIVPLMSFADRVENEHLSYAINSCSDDFSLEEFKLKYAYYTTDLCMSMEEGLRLVLSLHFSEIGLPSIGKAVLASAPSTILYDLLQELYQLIRPGTVKEIQKTLSGLLPYQDLYDYVSTKRKVTERIFTLKDWELEREKFVLFQQARRRDGTAVERIDRWAEDIMRSIQKQTKTK